MPSPSPSACDVLGVNGQLSLEFGTPSPSTSGLGGTGVSQAWPRPSPSVSCWPGFETVGQLSSGSDSPSLSVSVTGGGGGGEVRTASSASVQPRAPTTARTSTQRALRLCSI